jgi:cytoskeletal protein CcmA (bactofilin family)
MTATSTAKKPTPLAATDSEIHWVFVGEDTRVDGTLTTGSPVSVVGEVIGDVTSASQVEVAESATITGAVTGSEIVVAGVVTGPVHASGRLCILATGTVRGDVRVKSILVDEGGTLDGRCTMTSR